MAVVMTVAAAIGARVGGGCGQRADRDQGGSHKSELTHSVLSDPEASLREHSGVQTSELCRKFPLVPEASECFTDDPRFTPLFSIAGKSSAQRLNET
ncbi:transposase, IS4 family [Methylorubrum populi]|uniref:Transposase, IS4 family n=1 Tax=Methylorubrum populi TaxID=223967 RepID=A0A160PGA6_9HYPH|nr:transposase, IS4 family [Methylorubrum populi]